MRNNDARIINGRMYTLKPVKDPWNRKLPWKWAGYCEGERIGFYRKKQDFWSAVERLERSRDPACVLATQVEAEESLKGANLLNHLHLWNGKRE